MTNLRLAVVAALALSGCLPGTFPSDPPDPDGDGFSVRDGDCDDTNADINPETVWYVDDDGDAHGDEAVSLQQCDKPDGYVLSGGDCDDTNPDIRPEAAETCDQVDEDCDGVKDNGAPGSDKYFVDGDDDGFGDDATVEFSCDPVADRVTVGGDCDDADKTAFPGGTETCDTVDNDCNTQVDDDPTDGDVYFVDEDDDGFGSGLTEVFCDDPGAGYTDKTGDCDDKDDTVQDFLLWYADLDKDGFGDDAVTSKACTAPVDTVDKGGDCKDTDEDVHPGAAEVCDDVDQDCDGTADDNATDPTDWFLDDDADTYGAGTATAACDAPSVKHVDRDGDCDDADALYHPGAAETCSDTEDFNCDGSTGFTDGDGDGSPACLDCDDANEDINPAATELCDGANVDEDCDSVADDLDSSVSDATRTDWFADTDSDTYGATATLVRKCDAPTGFVNKNADCDDTKSAINPGATEVCDASNTDEDCDSKADDLDSPVSGRTTYYADVDADTHGDPTDGKDLCDVTGGRVTTQGDCDDTDANVHPGAPELCDGLADDCSPTWVAADEDGTVTFFPATGLAVVQDAAWGAGTQGNVATITLPDNGTVAVCKGTYFVAVRTAATGAASVLGAGAADVILDADGTDAVVTVVAGGGAEFTGVTLQHGTRGVLALDDFELHDGVIKENSSAGTGGGVSITNGQLSLDNAIVRDNDSVDNGGGVFAKDSTIVLARNAAVRGNDSAALGGGLYLDGTSLSATCTSSTGGVFGNIATTGGGGVFATGTLSITSTACNWGTATVDDNVPDDIVKDTAGNVIGTYVDAATFSCTGTSCVP